ncbi:MAG: hypothetical protein IPJ13_25980 [Saprospiraceae bacterium]|nr:hypothetical protein [Saprospiraceae bacterium]
MYARDFIFYNCYYVDFTQLSAQRPEGGSQASSITGVISVILIDSMTNKPAEFATIVLKLNPKRWLNKFGRSPMTFREFKFSEIKLAIMNCKFLFRLQR